MDKELLWQQAMNMKDWLIEIRRDLHMHPELGLAENRTSAVIQEQLSKLGISYETYEGQTAVVGTILGAYPGKTIGIRADMDALPLVEANAVPYRSQSEGVMHACGHDAHVAILLGAARLLGSMRDHLHGNIKLLFQPAEESVGGADSMVRAGCMKNPDVDYVIGLHVMPNLPCGTIETRYGALNAATDEVTITIEGSSAHGAYPEQGIDAIVIAGQVITALQSVTSRKISPLDSIVLTIGTIHGGTRSNVIADKVLMEASLRTIDPNIRKAVKEQIHSMVSGICRAYGGKGTVEIREGYEALINTAEAVDYIIDTARSVLGEGKLVLKEKPSLGAEDFSYFIDAAKGAFYHLGCGSPEKGIVSPLHSCSFDLDEDCMPVGVLMHAAIALNMMETDIK